MFSFSLTFGNLDPVVVYRTFRMVRHQQHVILWRFYIFTPRTDSYIIIYTIILINMRHDDDDS